ncbi:xylose isomerase [Photobacterium sanctipauli]|uniref:3-dehydroshikimate dehydratase n=3 Tax=Photobacterium sanctipauli TaxID=1342794 RepID=A0A2T3P136_9GAMM|nr:sugar phosphate isomerase/epimerase and 4-hydroxyphenylpyruvate domain-containing protein [Photobacterium sanctipauli]PSW22217.1 xylose isomerase [Photobacterium sanctipauli]
MKYSIATVCLSGTLAEKMEAAHKAGFHGIEIFEQDLTKFTGTPADVKRMAGDYGLEILALQPFRDMEGMPAPLRQQKYDMLEKKMALAHELGTKRMMMCSNVQPYSSPDLQQCAEDLHAVAQLAKQENIMLGYEALAWGRHIADYDDAWKLVNLVNHDNLGIVLDTFHMFARGNTLDTLINDIPLEKIALVQVADAPKLNMDVLQYSRHFRCFPGQGDLPVVEFLQALKAKGFDDYLSHEIFNDEFRASSPYEKAVDGIRSLKWLEDQAKEKKHTPPEVTDIEFIEFSVADKANNPVVKVLSSLGFETTHVHKSKDVELMKKGNVNIVLNKERNSNAHEFLNKHGESVCAIGLLSKDSTKSMAFAQRYHSDVILEANADTELSIPAAVGAGDTLVYFLDEKSPLKFYEADFEPLSDKHSAEDDNLVRIDHVGQTVSNTEMLSTIFFYKSMFGFETEKSYDLPDTNGLITSRTVTSPNNKVKIALNTTNASQTSSQHFLKQSNGASVNQIAFECRDIFVEAEKVDRDYLLDIPANYYRDLEARFGLEPELLAKLASNNIMYDQDEKGAFFHFYTQEFNGIFFEVVQRVGEYSRYGEENAFIRLSAQSMARNTD